MLLTIPSPDIQVGPLGAVAFWAVVVLAVIALITGITLGGMVVFVLFGVLIILAVYFIFQRLIRWLSGG